MSWLSVYRCCILQRRKGLRVYLQVVQYIQPKGPAQEFIIFQCQTWKNVGFKQVYIKLVRMIPIFSLSNFRHQKQEVGATLGTNSLSLSIFRFVKSEQPWRMKPNIPICCRIKIKDRTETYLLYAGETAIEHFTATF